jgi:hypothetical protein
MSNQPQQFTVQLTNLGQFNEVKAYGDVTVRYYFVRRENINHFSKAKLEDRRTIGGYFVLAERTHPNYWIEQCLTEVPFGSKKYYKLWSLVEQFSADHEDDPRKCYPTYTKETV